MRRALPAVAIVRRVRGGWLPTERDLRRWAGAALGARAAGRELSVLLVGPAASRALNARYRGLDRATNVLSFPAPPGTAAASGLLGDLVICPAVLRVEARAQHKSERAHWTHLVVHGVLHLAGYDHERTDDAQRMERREIRVLRGLGIANPYESPAPRARRSG
ncbi:MAG: rRNA maturation RNase YbeY [Steroidobacterales bacterium]